LIPDNGLEFDALRETGSVCVASAKRAKDSCLSSKSGYLEEFRDYHHVFCAIWTIGLRPAGFLMENLALQQQVNARPGRRLAGPGPPYPFVRSRRPTGEGLLPCR
jgi:hypothetical protein